MGPCPRPLPEPLLAPEIATALCEQVRTVLVIAYLRAVNLGMGETLPVKEVAEAPIHFEGGESGVELHRCLNPFSARYGLIPLKPICELGPIRSRSPFNNLRCQNARTLLPGP